MALLARGLHGLKGACVSVKQAWVSIEPVLVLTIALVCAVPAAAQSPPAQNPAAQVSAAQGSVAQGSVAQGSVARAHRAISTNVPAAQTAFDRGLVMLYAFNIGEARSAFRAAEAADPHAALPYFGEAVAETVDINMASTAEGERRGADAVDRGRKRLAADTPADERALLAAAALRYERGKPHDQRFATYFRAMQAYVLAHPDDGLGATMAAYAGWNATGSLIQGAGDQGAAGDLTPDARIIAGDLDAALKLDSNDLGAHHLRIHFWEQAGHPERALSDADYLAALVYEPGESHLEHMAGHIYDRLGDYTQMVRVNEGACANDAAYFALGNGDGQKYMHSYHEHDVDFVLYGLTTVGRNVAARAFAARDSDYSRELVALRTHDDRTLLGLLGAAITPMRVIAEARSGDLDAARKDLSTLGSSKGNAGGDTDADVATAVVARAAHDDLAAIDAYRRASAKGGRDLGDPKNRWWAPIAEGLGATLLEAHRPVEAQRVFGDELTRYPGDPHLEFGLAQALAAQGKDDRAARAAYLAAWQGEKPLTVADLG